MNIETGRFGEITVNKEENLIHFPNGLIGLTELKDFCVVDPCNDTLILWLQSLDEPDFAFPVLEPKIFEEKYKVQLSAAEMRELKLDNLKNISVLSIITIPSNISEMTANLKAPVVINLDNNNAKQVVLQENSYSLKHLMFKELKAHLMTIQAQHKEPVSAVKQAYVLDVKTLPVAHSVSALE